MGFQLVEAIIWKTMTTAKTKLLQLSVEHRSCPHVREDDVNA
jgi:hypothetical protein